MTITMITMTLGTPRGHQGDTAPPPTQMLTPKKKKNTNLIVRVALGLVWGLWVAPGCCFHRLRHQRDTNETPSEPKMPYFYLKKSLRSTTDAPLTHH